MTSRALAWFKAGVFCACLLPLCLLLARSTGFGDLGANPVQEVLHTLGITALNLLLITLAVTPVRKLTGLVWLVRVRRSLGLFAFAYAMLHALTYVAVDQRLAWGDLIVDVTERPYITAGFLALLLMVPLAVTSTNAMQRRLGRRWVSLHRSVYLIGALGVLHFFWQVKLDTSGPTLYALILAVLLGYRVVAWLRRRRRRAAAVNRP
jgi:sulfoxide reductase heme-binding subunit YedZ